MSKTFELEGPIKEIMETKTFPSGFCKREFVITEEDDRWPQDIKFAMIKERCALLDNMKPQDRVRVSFSLRGNFYQGRYYTDLQAYKIEKLDVDGSSSEPYAEPADIPVLPADTVDDDEMPF